MKIGEGHARVDPGGRVRAYALTQLPKIAPAYPSNFFFFNIIIMPPSIMTMLISSCFSHILCPFVK
jgi:hypothetical protein